MESERVYRGIFYAGSGWNFLASIPTLFLVGSLPGLIDIEAPNYPIFVYFNLITMSMYGCVQFAVARHLATSRPYVKILVWAKFLTVLCFIFGLLFLSMPPNLSSFLGPGIFLDLIFGLLFWRYLVFSSKTAAAVET
jgi:hypothetical protein